MVEQLKTKVSAKDAERIVTVTVDGKQVQVPGNTTILDACRKAGQNVPTLCYLKGINEIGSCRVCVVEVEGVDQLVASCNNYVLDGMSIKTNSPKVRLARRENVMLLLAQHDTTCTTCARGGNCKLAEVSNDLGIIDSPYKSILANTPWPHDFPLIRNNDKCIRCMRCIQICDKVQASHIWGITNRATHTLVDVAGGANIHDVDCTLCGQCITHCPTGALRERDDVMRVYDALADPDVTTIVQIAPSVRTSWAEHWGLSDEKATIQHMVAALRPMGFDYIVNTDFSADLTIMEEGTELLEHMRRNANGGSGFPMFTSCCPGWVRYCKAHYPEFVDQISTSKSPQQMFGAIAKTWYAQMLNVPPSKLCVVSIMPCIAKKHECAIPTINDADAGRDVDYALTTREMNRMIRSTHIDPHDLKERKLDMPLGLGSGAGAIFGATGGVMEAALRTAYYAVTGENPDPDAFRDVRGIEGWKEETFDLNGTPLRVAVVSGLGNAGKLLEALKRGDVEYDFVEVMACPGGCVGGGGQPIHDGVEMAESRGKILYDIDGKMSLRFSHENPSIIDCYEKFLGKPLSERSEHLLHTDHHSWKMPNEE